MNSKGLIIVFMSLFLLSVGLRAEEKQAIEGDAKEEQTEESNAPAFPPPILEEIAPGFYHPIYVFPKEDTPPLDT